VSQAVYKVDHSFGPKLSVFGRFTHDDVPTVEQGGLFTGSSYPGLAVTNTNSPGKTLSAHATLTLSQTLLNEIGYGYSYGAVLSDPVGLGASKNSPDIKPNLPFTSQIPRVPDLTLTAGEHIARFGGLRAYPMNY